LRPIPEDDQEIIARENEEVSWATPDDQLEDALSQLEQWTAEELLEAIGRSSPKFFETLVLDLLHAMGYGASQADLQHVGRSGDGGIDGIISLDRLGLEKVFVQAKRWQNPVGPSQFKHSMALLRGGVLTRESSSQLPVLHLGPVILPS
jgi:restriction system protein